MQIYYKKYYVLIKCFKFMGMDSNQELYLVPSFFSNIQQETQFRIRLSIISKDKTKCETTLSAL